MMPSPVFCCAQGQACCAGTRVYVHESIYEEFIEKVAGLARAMGEDTGNPTLDSTQIVSAHRLKPCLKVALFE